MKIDGKIIRAIQWTFELDTETAVEIAFRYLNGDYEYLKRYFWGLRKCNGKKKQGEYVRRQFEGMRKQYESLPEDPYMDFALAVRNLQYAWWTEVIKPILDFMIPIIEFISKVCHGIQNIFQKK